LAELRETLRESELTHLQIRAIYWKIVGERSYLLTVLTLFICQPDDNRDFVENQIQKSATQVKRTETIDYSPRQK
jgi:hypothetical protein